MNLTSHLRLWIIPLVFVGLYGFLPNRNPGNDAWAYAAAARWGEELFSPHHLLYNLPGWLWSRAFQGWRVIEFMQALNAFSAGICLFLVGRLLQGKGLALPSVRLLQALIGSSFVVFHYATENEAYILPMVFALGGLSFLHGPNLIFSNQRLLRAGFLLALAVLIHQQHLVTLLTAFGFLFITGNAPRLKTIIWFLVPALALIAFGYVSAWEIEPLLANPFQYFFHDFYQGSARWVAGGKHWILAPVNLIRIFLYLHGDLLGLMKQEGVMAMTGLSGGIFFLTGIVLGVRKFLRGRHSSSTSISQDKNLHPISGGSISGPLHTVQNLLIRFATSTGISGFVGLAHLLFALWFGANHEFMVPLPFLFGVAAGGSMMGIYRPALYWCLSGLMIWNLTLSGVTQRFMTTDPSVALAQMVQQYPQAVWVLYDESRIRHILKYYSGEDPQNLLHGPEWYAETGRDVSELSEIIQEALNRDYAVYSDCPERPRPWNRASMTRVKAEDYWQNWETGFVMSVPTLSHSYPVFRILPARADNQSVR
jgi:hypothetical protein